MVIINALSLPQLATTFRKYDYLRNVPMYPDVRRGGLIICTESKIGVAKQRSA